MSRIRGYVERRWYKDWSGEDILCKGIDVLILSESGGVYIEQDDDTIMLTTEQAIELREILGDVK